MGVTVTLTSRQGVREGPMRHIHLFATRLALAVVVVVVALPATAWPACLPGLAESGSGEPYEYMSAVVASMGHAKDGLDRFQNRKENAPPHDLLYRLKLAQEDYACAQKSVANFTQSKDERVRGTAELLALVFGNIGDVDRLAGAQLVALMNQTSPVPPGTMSDMIATFHQQNDGAWSDLMHAIIVTTQTPQTFKEDGTNARSLRVTKAERQRLKRDLERIFGASIRKGMHAGQDYLTTAAAGLHSFLANPQFRSADER
jgi:hypothetical protein